MAEKIVFTKMHGAGNDYIYVNTMVQEIADPAACARLWSDRHTGIGADGLVLIGAASVADADFSMRIFNADGSEAMMCGNAARCIGKYLHEKGLTRKTDIGLQTRSGVKRLHVNLDAERCVESVTVDMQAPRFDAEEQYRPLVAGASADALPEGFFVSMGNPHYVVFTNDLTDSHVKGEGHRIEHHAAFPERTNVEFVSQLLDGRLRVRVWERGSGITMACGTGACAVAVAAIRTGRAREMVRVVMDGGELTVRWAEHNSHVYLSGPAETVFEGEIALPDTARKDV